MDVRDTARAHRLCAESTTIPNGSRYCLVASDRSGELLTHELQAKLLKLYPDVDVRAAGSGRPWRRRGSEAAWDRSRRR